MDCICHIMTDAEHCTKGICTWTQVRNCPHELHGLSLFLQRICAVACTQKFDFGCLNFNRLTSTDRLNQHTVHAETCTGCELLYKFFVKFVSVNNYLHIIDGRAVVQRHKSDLFATTAGSDPSSYINFSSCCSILQQVRYFCSFYRFHTIIL